MSAIQAGPDETVQTPRRKITLTVNLTRGERQAFGRCAQAWRMNISEMVRQLVWRELKSLGLELPPIVADAEPEEP